MLTYINGELLDTSWTISCSQAFEELKVFVNANVIIAFQGEYNYEHGTADYRSTILLVGAIVLPRGTGTARTWFGGAACISRFLAA